LGLLAKEIHATQREDHTVIRQSVIGRPLLLEGEARINYQLSSYLSRTGRYHQLGQLGLIYIFSNEIKDGLGQTFFNRSQISESIAAAGKSTKDTIMVGRSELRIGEPLHHNNPLKPPFFWLQAQLTSACDSLNGERVNTQREELAIANGLFLEDMDTTDAQQLWFGAVSAPTIDAATEIAEGLEEIIPPVLEAESVRLIRKKPYL
jgi:hypothetical protein